MKAEATADAAAEINRLHSEVQRCATQSRQQLTAALAAAWQAGRLLAAERKRVVTKMGRSSWPVWVRANFRGSLRTAQRYVLLATSIADPSAFAGLSLRQVYFRLGIATEPKKSRHHSVAPLPAYVRLASRLLCALKRPPRGNDRSAVLAAYRRDLRVLYEQLRPIFAEANQSPEIVSKRP